MFPVDQLDQCFWAPVDSNTEFTVTDMSRVSLQHCKNDLKLKGTLFKLALRTR